MLVQFFQSGLMDGDACINGIKCSAKDSETNIFYDFGPDLTCSTAVWPEIRRRASKKCTGATPRCFGGHIGFGAAPGSLIKSGPCLAEPKCSTAGKFPVFYNNERGKYEHVLF